MKNKKIFVTGATGFIGQNLIIELAKNNDVFALVRHKSINKLAHLKNIIKEVIIGDLLDVNSYADKLNEVDYVFHLAALYKLDAPKEALYKHNVIGTQKLLEICINKKIEKIVYFSTAYVAGAKDVDLATEQDPLPERFKNWYEWSKAEGEKIALYFYKQYRLPLIIVRPTIVYGPNNFYALYKVLSLISDNKLFIYPGSGKNKAHLVHVEDVVNATIHLADLENRYGEIYYICEDYPRSCREIIKLLCRELGKKPPLVAVPRFIVKMLSESFVWKLIFKDFSKEFLDYFFYHQTFSNNKLKNSGYIFRYPDPYDGLRSFVIWYRSHK
ncbi:MAG: NAD(P)-dependent oxidoreductase [Actinomycetota bacterium]|nr:NAD(P)-dependent oxidoreductase [Actinomycetota bacterium]